ncbi:hypothetical protein D1815_06205 [Aquimarina sp. AD1]|uniref:hypothetical protein n=1 Tax=Aquimarina sp. (strain AD1) TaxID=1714848 RepID=UPI000E4ADDDD|nr:hypothetical protein [Aquimarina sp. AD1]AXT55369.1 hypothetical protein D1815_06205 [Aquimarina sp. AD1]RKN27211.1 hypothetical protein D7035_09020 [Aquimarina sp. AD1]
MINPKTIPFFIIITLLFIGGCKKEESSINYLSAPDNWRKETIEFPLSFAPSINYKGTEYVRFAPGWGKEGAEDYFSYAFLWYLDEKPTLSNIVLESQLEDYFIGLMQGMVKSEADATKKVKETKAFFEKIDNTSYAGKVMTYDAFTTKKEVALNIIATYIECNSIDKHLVIFRISPKEIDHSIWNRLNEIQVSIDCKK